MAASYSTGTATGPTDLLQKLVTWLVAQGWTQDSSASSGSGWRAHLHKGGQYVNLRAFVGEAANVSTGWGTGSGASGTTGYGIGLYLGDGYNGANGWNAQTGGPKDSGGTNPVGAGMQLGSGSIPAYHFFDDGNDHVTVVVNRGGGIFSHMGWGPSLAKIGFTNDHWYFYASSPHTYNVAGSGLGQPGGDVTAATPMAISFFTGGFHYACAFVRTDAAVYTNRWLGFRGASGTTATYGYTGRQGRSALDTTGSLSNTGEYLKLSPLLTRAWQSAFAGALLLPISCFAESAAARWIPIGHPPTVFFCVGVGHGFTAGQVYSVGGLNYMLFPNFAVRKAA